MPLQYAMGQDAYHSGERFHDDFCDEWKRGYNDERNANMTQWGPEIAVNGVRPEGLTNDCRFRVRGLEGWWDSSYDGCIVHWENVTHIRLPADHPHYSKDDVPDWAIERAKELIREEIAKRDVPFFVYDVASATVLARYIAQHEQPPMDEVDSFLAATETRGLTQGAFLRAFLKWQKEQG